MGFGIGRASRGIAILALLPALAEAADVTIAPTSTGVNLDTETGSTAEIGTGVSVSNDPAGRAVTATTAAWALTNRGSIASIAAYAVGLDVAGSSVSNYGTITSPSGNAVVLFNGGQIDNQAGATVSASISAISIGHSSGTPGGAGIVTNAGSLIQTASGSADLVVLVYGGTVTNLAGGTISAIGNGRNAVSISRGATRTVINSGTITSTGTGFAAGVLVQTGASSVTNTLTGTIGGTYNGVYAGSDAVLTLGNDGTIESTGANASSRAVEAAGGGAITNTGTIRSTAGDGVYLGRAGTVINSGTITGATRAITFSGNYARTLELQTGSLLNGNVQGGSGVDGLVLSGSGTESIAKFLAFETLSMQGTAWDLTGAGSFATSAAITAGTLTVSGTLTSPAISIGAAGIVTGTGTLAGAVSNAGTLLVPTGTLTVAGGLTTVGGSHLAVGVTPTSSGLVAVSGAASLAGGTVDVRAAAATYAPSTVYTILSASGGVSGSFDGVTSNLVFLAPTLSYDANAVYLRLDRSLVSFTSAGITPNQVATGAALDSLPPDDPLVAPLAQLELAEAGPAFDQLAGEIYAATAGIVAEETRLPREAALDQVDAAFRAIAASRDSRRWSVWAKSLATRGTVEGDGNAAALESRAGGLFVGANGLIDDNFLLGVFGGVTSSTATLAGRGSSAEIESYHLGVTAATELGDMTLKLGAAGSFSTVATDRTISLPGFDDSTSASFDIATGQLFGELAYTITEGNTTFSPFGRLTLIGVRSGDYAEAGGDAALAGATDGYGLVLASLGLSAETSVELHDGLAISAHGKLALQQAFGDAPTATHHFAESGDFTIAGAPLAGTSLLVEAGLTADLAPGVALDFSYSGELAATHQSHAIKATLSGRF